MNGIELIAKEREEQLTKHGRTIEDDVKYNSNRELSLAASALSNPVLLNNQTIVEYIPSSWDRDARLKMASKPYKERLIIAGALIAAEIDRLIAIENKYMYITIKAELIYEFATFEDWINKASAHLGGFRSDEVITYIDKNGNAFNTGKQLIHARDNDLFPVKAYRLIKNTEL